MKIFSMFKMYRGLPRSLYVLFFARIINSLGMFVYPFLTMFLTQRLGFSEAKAGVFIALSGLMVVPGSLLGGKLADKIGRKKIYVIAQFIAAGLFIPCGFLGNSIVIPYLIIIVDFFNGLIHPTQAAMATDLSNPENRQAAFSLLYLGHNVGFAVGPIIAGFLFANFTFLIFLGDAFTTIISVILVMILVPETMPDQDSIETRLDDDSGEKAEQGGLLKALLTRPYLILFMLFLMIMNFVYAQMMFSLPLFNVELFGDRGPVVFGSIMTENAVIVIVLTAAIIALTKKIGPMLNTAVAGLLYALGFGMLFFVDKVLFLYLSTFIWTVGEIVAVTNSEVYIANHTPISHRGRFNSIRPLIMEAGWALSPPLMGLFIGATSIRMVWVLSFGLCMFSSVCMLILRGVEKKRHPDRYLQTPNAAEEEIEK